MRIRILKYFFKLIRLPNLILVAATQYMIRYLILFPMLDKNNIHLQLSEFEFLLLVVSTIFITAGGYVINDYFDRKTDLLNRPKTVIVGRFIKRRAAMATHLVFNILGVCIGIYLSFRIDLLLYSMVFVLVSGLLWFYSTTYKRQLLTGNILVSILTACVPLLVLIFELPLLSRNYGSMVDAMGVSVKLLAGWVIGYSAFAFLLSMSREIIKDTEDFEGDNAYGMNTLPIAFGIKKTKWAIIAINLIVILSIIIIYIFYLKKLFILAYILLFIAIPLFIVIHIIHKAKSKKEYHAASNITKYIMIAGILFALLARFYIF